MRPETIEHTFVVENECHGWRLDRFLHKKIPRLSRTRVQRVIRGECLLDGRVCKPSSLVVPGQVVQVQVLDPLGQSGWVYLSYGGMTIPVEVISDLTAPVAVPSLPPATPSFNQPMPPVPGGNGLTPPSEALPPLPQPPLK